jgi:hypothetical protein
MTSKTFNTIEENIKLGMIDYIQYIREDQPELIEDINTLITRFSYNNDNSKYLIYENLIKSEYDDFERFCGRRGYFCRHDDLQSLQLYINTYKTEEPPNLDQIDFYWNLSICVNIYYKKMGNEFIDLWNNLTNVHVVSNNILK